MNFEIGPYRYTLLLSASPLYDGDGNTLEGLAVEHRRWLLVGPNVAPERRREIAAHEYCEAWFFHVPKPATDEERCQLFAFLSEQFERDLQNQGGAAALLDLPLTTLPPIGAPPAPDRVPPPNGGDYRITDRVFCGCCDAQILCGSTSNTAPAFHAASQCWRITRWATCDACGSLQVWGEVASEDGTPTGVFVANPPPRVMRGAEAAAWLAERAGVTV